MNNPDYNLFHSVAVDFAETINTAGDSRNALIVIHKTENPELDVKFILVGQEIDISAMLMSAAMANKVFFDAILMAASALLEQQS